MFQPSSRATLKLKHAQPTPFNTYGGVISAVEQYSRERTVADSLVSRDRELFNPSVGVGHAKYAQSVRGRIKKKREDKEKKFDEVTGKIVQKAIYGGILKELIATHSDTPAKRQLLAELVGEQQFREKEDDLLTLAAAREILGVDRGKLPENVLEEISRLGEAPNGRREVNAKEILETLTRYKTGADMEAQRGAFFRVENQRGSAPPPPKTLLGPSKLPKEFEGLSLDETIEGIQGLRKRKSELAESLNRKLTPGEKKAITERKKGYEEAINLLSSHHKISKKKGRIKDTTMPFRLGYLEDEGEYGGEGSGHQ